jgi:hypothetical protein
MWRGGSLHCARRRKKTRYRRAATRLLAGRLDRERSWPNGVAIARRSPPSVSAPVLAALETSQEVGIVLEMHVARICRIG